MKLKKLFTLISISVLCAACQSLPPSSEAGSSGTGSTAASAPETSSSDQPRPTQRTAKPVKRPVRPTDIVVVEDEEPIPDDLWQALRQDFSWAPVDNSRVDQARNSYLAQHTYFQVIAERANLYLYYIVEAVKERGMPVEVALLPLVESTLDPFARSSGHAAGLWQIMPATGRHLGLNTTWWYEGRMDIRTSTQAALDYLEALNTAFAGDWLLALAAYNSGEGRVRRAVANNQRAGKATDFWSLSLPRETRAYVPRLLALADIIADPERYQASLPPVPNRPAFAVATTGGQIDFARAAQLAGIDESELRALNPGQLQWATAPNQAPELLVPPGTLSDFETRLASLPANDRVRWRRYRIQSGDSLSQIARQFHTKVALIKEANQLHNNVIRAGDTLLIPQGSRSSQGLLLAKGEPKQSRAYRVRAGDSLYRIAQRFEVTVEDIVSWNSLNPRAYLRPGQRLTLYVKSGS